MAHGVPDELRPSGRPFQSRPRRASCATSSAWPAPAQPSPWARAPRVRPANVHPMSWKPTGDHEVDERPLKPGRGARGRSGATEAFFRTDGAEQDPLLVVYHIQKTAGTSFRRVVRVNLPPGDVELVPNLPSAERTPAGLLVWAGEWYRSLDDDRRSRLCCVMSHWARYLLPALDRPAESLALVREPLDRTLSYYHFKQRRRGPERPLEPLERLYERIEGDPSGGVSVAGLEQYANWQSRCLLAVFHDVRTCPVTAAQSPDAELWRERLRELVGRVFVVGVQDPASRSTWPSSLATTGGRRLCHAARSTPAGRRRPTSRRSSARRFCPYNWLDQELHELGRRSQEGREDAWEGACARRSGVEAVQRRPGSSPRARGGEAGERVDRGVLSEEGPKSRSRWSSSTTSRRPRVRRCARSCGRICHLRTWRSLRTCVTSDTSRTTFGGGTATGISPWTPTARHGSAV